MINLHKIEYCIITDISKDNNLQTVLMERLYFLCFTDLSHLFHRFVSHFVDKQYFFC